MQEKYKIKNILRYYIGGKIERFYFRFLLPRFEIDRGLINKTIQEFNLDAITSDLKEVYSNLSFLKTDNIDYFDTMLTWCRADRYLPDNPFFLNPPNVAAIDFLLKHAKKDSYILDYCSGLGNLLIYLKKMGFKNAFGYDNFSQVSSETVNNFLVNFNYPDIVLPKDQALKLKTNIALCISYFWNRLDKDIIEKEVNNPAIEYILLDYPYASRHIQNFKIIGVYKNLLIVFKRKR